MNKNTKKLVGVALFTAIVIVLQLIGGGIKVGAFSVSLVLIPIVLGTALYGIGAGAWLGLVFGVTVLLTGDAAAFLAVNAFGTVATVLVKGILAGTLSGLMYKAFEKKNKYLATAAAAVTCPIVNTGIFLLGCLIFLCQQLRDGHRDSALNPQLNICLPALWESTSFLSLPLIYCFAPSS